MTFMIPFENIIFHTFDNMMTYYLYLEQYNYVVLHHTLPVFTGLGWCLIINWDFSGAVSIFGPDALPAVHQ